MKLIKLIAFIVGGLFVLLVATVLLLLAVGVSVDGSWLRGGVENSATAALGRDVRIDGRLILHLSSTPGIEADGVNIANVPGAKADQFLVARALRLSVALSALLRGKIHAGEVSARDVSLNLESDADGRGNWMFGSPEDRSRQPAPSPTQADAKSVRKAKEGSLRLIGVDKLSVENIVVTYHDAALNKILRLDLDTFDGTAAPGQSVKFSMAGAFQDQPFNLSLNGDALDKLAQRGEPWKLSLNGEIAGTALGAEGGFIPGDGARALQVAVDVGSVDIGATLAWFDLVEGLEAKVGGLRMKLSLAGNSLKELVNESAVTFTLRDGQWTVRDRNTQASFDITGLSGDVLLEQGNATTVKLNGKIDQIPVGIAIIGAPLANYVTSADKVPLTIEVVLAQARLNLAGTLALPITQRDLRFKAKFDGKRLDALNDLFELDLPAVGPLALEADLAVTQAGYDLSSLVLQVGESRLQGKLTLNTSLKKPKVEIDLVSPQLQINDFVTRERKEAGSLTTREAPGRVAATKQQDQAPKRKDAPATNDDGRRQLLSYEVLSALNGELVVAAKQVLSGEDKLGSAHMVVTLQDTYFAVRPLRLDVPGGAVQVGFGYRPTQSDVSVDLKANIEEFDIGILSRRAKPATDMGGKITLDVALDSRAPDLKSIMATARGHIDFILVPENFSAGIIDLWAVNLLSAIMSGGTQKDKSEVNCVVVRLDMKDGLMTEQAIYMDTTRMRVAGDAEINFKTERIDIKIAPKAKKAQFFSLATPLQIRGSFEDFGLGVKPGGLAGTVVSVVTSPIHVPFRRIFAKKAPIDGREACREAWTKTSAEPR